MLSATNLLHPPANRAITLGRDGTRVSIHLTCHDLTAALDLYRSLCEEINSGSLILDISVPPLFVVDV